MLARPILDIAPVPVPYAIIVHRIAERIDPRG
jgi:hypothetical protein